MTSTTPKPAITLDRIPQLFQPWRPIVREAGCACILLAFTSATPVLHRRSPPMIRLAAKMRPRDEHHVNWPPVVIAGGAEHLAAVDPLLPNGGPNRCPGC
jgi:hypothetical protein